MALRVFVVLALAACGDNTRCEPTLFTGSVWGGNLAIADDVAYFTTFAADDGTSDHAVRGVSTCGGAASVVADSEPGDLFGYGMAVRDGQVYWSQYTDVADAPSIFRAPTAGGSRTMLATFHSAQAPYQGVAVDDAQVYAASNAEIIAAPLAGGDATTLYTGSVQWIVLHAGSLYFTADGALMRIDPGAQPTLVASVANLAGGSFDLDDTAAYLATTDAIVSVPLAGGAPTTLATNLSSPSKVVLAPNHDVLFQAATASGFGVMRLPAGASTPELVHDGIRVDAGVMTVDDSSLYVAYCCGDSGAVTGGAVLRLEL